MLVILCFGVTTISAQNTWLNDNNVYDRVDKTPFFPGGQQAFNKFWDKVNATYPTIAEENGVQARVIVSFVVEKNGEISNAKRVSQSVDLDLEKEALRIVNAMPRWTQGKKYGRVVRTEVILPVVFSVSSKGQGSIKLELNLSPIESNTSNAKSAIEVLKEFAESPKNINIFLDGLKTSDSPKDYYYIMEDFVAICLNNDITSEVLLNELENTVLPKDPDVATSFGVSLAKYSGFDERAKILNKIPKTHSFDKENIKDAVIYPNGSIMFNTPKAIEVFKLYGLSTAPEWIPDYNDLYERRFAQFNDNRTMILYEPTGKCLWGLFKYANKENIDYSYTIDKANPNDKLDLAIGLIFDSKGDKVGEKILEHNSFEEAYNAIKAKEKKDVAEKKAELDRKNAVVKKKLVAKYGLKAYNAMNTLNPYVGMPEGIITEMIFFTDIGTWMPYGFSHVEYDSNVYYQSKELAALKFAGTFKAPTAIYTRNGRVSAIKW